MLNSALGTSSKVDGRSCFLTARGRRGYAVYGPYESVEPGRYAVGFRLALAGDAPDGADFCCAEIDVAGDVGRTVIAHRKLFVSQLRDGRSDFTLRFDLADPKRLEYRVKTTGRVPLLIDEHRTMVRLDGDDADADAEAQIAARRFPDEAAAHIPFFREQRDELRSLYDRGLCGVRVVGDDIVLDTKAASFYAKTADDLQLVGEVLFDNVYNFTGGSRFSVIDIGMNIGLASLQFASRTEVAEVHSFEPFANTYDRAVDNLALNEPASRKVTPHNVGLSDRDSDGPVIVSQTAVSGAMSTVGGADGVAITVRLRDAATTLRPIIEGARARGLRTIVKMDCEGSEFAIMRSLVAGGLLPMIGAMMVEWHAMFDDQGLDDLLDPLRDAGFLIFDRSPPVGNGFFYAVRLPDDG